MARAGEGVGCLPGVVGQWRGGGGGGEQVSPFGLQAGGFLRCLGLLGQPFLLRGLRGGFFGSGLLALLDERIERCLLFLERGFAGGDVERGVVGDGRVLVRAAQRAGFAGL